MTTESMMTDATQPNEGEAASTTADQTTATAAVQEGQQQQGEQAQQAEQALPKSYEFTAPEGVDLADGAKEAYAEIAKDLKLTQEQAQAAFEKLASKGHASQIARVEAMKSEWAQSATSDPEFGGEKLPENLSVAKQALDAFGTPALKKLLNESGLGNHPEIIRAFYRAGKAISQDGFVAGGSTSPEKQRLFPSSDMKL